MDIKTDFDGALAWESTFLDYVNSYEVTIIFMTMQSIPNDVSDEIFIFQSVFPSAYSIAFAKSSSVLPLKR